MEAVPDGALRDLGLLVLAVPSSSGGSWHPERLMRGLVGLDGSPRASGYAPILTPSPPWPARSWLGSVRLPSTAVTIAGAVLLFGLPFTARRRGWHFPAVEEPDQVATNRTVHAQGWEG
jgi:hypothetical protein